MPNFTSFKRTPVQIAERAQNTGCDLQCRKMSEFSKTEYAQKTPLQIANEGQHDRCRKNIHRVSFITFHEECFYRVSI